MALVSGQRSTLNPNAPLFIPTAYRQVEDFSPEWWQLVTTSTWFRDFWASQHPEGSFGATAVGGDDVDVMDLLPDDVDIGVADEFSNLEAQFEELVMLAEAQEKSECTDAAPKRERPGLNGLKMDAKAMLVKDLNAPMSPKGISPKVSAAPPKYQMKPAHCSRARCTTRRIQQPR